MDRFSVGAAVAIVSLAAGSTALAVDWSEGVVVSAHKPVRGGSLDDRAVYACARSMMDTMFPGKDSIRVYTNPGDNQVFDNSVDSSLPGVRMSVLLKATDAATGETLGTAECDVSRDAKVQSLKPDATDLPPGQ
jgi:hypothetical protein